MRGFNIGKRTPTMRARIVLHFLMSCAAWTVDGVNEEEHVPFFTPIPAERGGQVSVNCNLRNSGVTEASRVNEVFGVFVEVNDLSLRYIRISVADLSEDPELGDEDRQFYSVTYGNGSYPDQDLRKLHMYIKLHLTRARCEDSTQYTCSAYIRYKNSRDRVVIKNTKTLQIMVPKDITHDVTPKARRYDIRRNLTFTCQAPVDVNATVQWFTGRSCSNTGGRLTPHNSATSTVVTRQHPGFTDVRMGRRKDVCPNLVFMNMTTTVETTRQLCRVRCQYTLPTLDAKGKRIVWSNDFLLDINGYLPEDVPTGDTIDNRDMPDFNDRGDYGDTNDGAKGGGGRNGTGGVADNSSARDRDGRHGNRSDEDVSKPRPHHNDNEKDDNSDNEESGGEKSDVKSFVKSYGWIIALGLIAVFTLALLGVTRHLCRREEGKGKAPSPRAPSVEAPSMSAVSGTTLDTRSQTTGDTSAYSSYAESSVD